MFWNECWSKFDYYSKVLYELINQWMDEFMMELTAWIELKITINRIKLDQMILGKNSNRNCQWHDLINMENPNSKRNMIIVIMNMMILMLQATVKSLLVTAHQGSIINEIKEWKDKNQSHPKQDNEDEEDEQYKFKGIIWNE